MYLKKIKFNNKFLFLRVVVACVSWPFSASRGNKFSTRLSLLHTQGTLCAQRFLILKKKQN